MKGKKFDFGIDLFTKIRDVIIVFFFIRKFESSLHKINNENKTKFMMDNF